MIETDIFFIITAGIVGLLGGSFLTVVIHRGPVIWGLVTNNSVYPQHYSLALPRSHCPHCKHPLGPQDLIPLLSYFAVRGKCRYCGTKISSFYPMVELLGVMSAMVAIALPLAWLPSLAAFTLFLFLVALGMIDARTGYLPDALTLPLITMGILLSIGNIFIPLGQSLWGAGLGYTSFWLISTLYKAIRKQDGLGLGDAKLMAAAGAFLGPFALPFMVLMAALSALITIMVLRVKGGAIDPQTEIRFGPYLASSIALCFTLTHSAPNMMPWIMGI
ncbi:MAG: A24 family peptidase [Pseudomonadota bacterium]